MSVEQLNAFREFVDANESVQEQLQAAAKEGEIDLPAFANEHGYEIDFDDIATSLEAGSGNMELTDFELSQVSGGVACAAIPIAAAIAKGAAAAASAKAVTAGAGKVASTVFVEFGSAALGDLITNPKQATSEC